MNAWASSHPAALDAADGEGASQRPETTCGRAAAGRQGAGAAALILRELPASFPATSHWKLAALAGRVSELSGFGPTSALSLTFSLVLEAQQRGEPVAWITSRTSTFFPPDAAANGVDLDALPVVFVPDAPAAARAAECLGRSGAFGLLVLDLVSCTEAPLSPSRALDLPGSVEPSSRIPAIPSPVHLGSSAAGSSSRAAKFRRRALVEKCPYVPAALLSRLMGLSQRHGMAVLCLTTKSPDGVSLGPLVSLRCQALREEQGRYFSCRLDVLKDKRRGPGWRHAEVFDGPSGLR